MKTAEELHSYILCSQVMLSTATLDRLFNIASELNDRCDALESRLAVAEGKLNAGQENKLSATPFQP